MGEYAGVQAGMTILTVPCRWPKTLRVSPLSKPFSRAFQEAPLRMAVDYPFRSYRIHHNSAESGPPIRARVSR